MTSSATAPDRKYQVFISSTFRDLERERRLVLDAVIDRGHIPVALERYPAIDTPVSSVIASTISNSQIYIVLVGHRYGTIADHAAQKSFSEYEFDLAKASGLVIVPFVLDENELKDKRKVMKAELATLQAEETDLKPESSSAQWIHKRIDELRTELSNEASLIRFRATVGRERLQQIFKTGDDRLSGAIMRSLEIAERDAHERKILGWVKEPEKTELAEVLQALSGNELLVDTVKQLGGFEKVAPRFGDHAEDKEEAASFFATTYLPFLRRKKVSLFFESGSSVAHVAKELGDAMAGTISTNNVLAYLYLLLKYRIPCSLFPWGPPELHYGATFGILDDRYPKEPKPEFPPKPLDTFAKETTQIFQGDPYSPSRWVSPKDASPEKEAGLLLCALSGLQLSETYETIPPRATIADCQGPHVGSFKNKLFKRFLYATGLPLAIFMHADKVDCPIDIAKCHFVLDSELPWSRFREEFPLALCVGCRSSDMARYLAIFRAQGFEILESRGVGANKAFIARNQRFIDSFEVPIGFNG